MDQFNQLLEPMPEKGDVFPFFRQRVMRKIYLLKYRNLFYQILPAVSFILVFSLWKMWKHLFVTNAYIVMIDLVKNEFTLTSAFWQEFFATLKDIGSFYSVIGALVSTVILFLCSLLLLYVEHTSRLSQKI